MNDHYWSDDRLHSRCRVQSVQLAKVVDVGYVMPMR